MVISKFIAAHRPIGTHKIEIQAMQTPDFLNILHRTSFHLLIVLSNITRVSRQSAASHPCPGFDARKGKISIKLTHNLDLEPKCEPTGFQLQALTQNLREMGSRNAFFFFHGISHERSIGSSSLFAKVSSVESIRDARVDIAQPRVGCSLS